MRYCFLRSALLVGCYSLLTVTGIAAAERPAPMSTQMSLQGFGGALNTPSAFVADEGTVQFQYANQQNYNPVVGRIPKWQDQYMLSVGMFDFAEIGGRLTWSEPAYSLNDLSGNFKLTTAPLKKFSPWIPNIAGGIQDVGGGARFFQTKYIVASEDIWKLRLSVGYGFGPDRMKGAFGSGEFRPFDWLHLLGEYDTRVANVGGRLISPPLPYFPVQLTFTGMTSIENRPGNFSMGVGFSLPLGFRGQESRVQGQGSRVKEKQEDRVKGQGDVLSLSKGARGQESLEDRGQEKSDRGLTAGAAVPLQVPEQPVTDGQLQEMLQRLTSAGFVNVKVGLHGNSTLVVEYENSRYNHNELDALGVVGGIALQKPLNSIERFWLVIKRKGIRMMLVDVPAGIMRSFLFGESDISALQDGMMVTNDTKAVDAVTFVQGDSQPGWFWPSVMLSPTLSTFVGTEVGPFEYYLGMRLDSSATLWPGGLLNMRWELPVSWSEELDNGRIYAGTRKNSHMDRLMLHQAVKLWPGAMLNVGGGKVLDNNYGTLNEFVWQPGSGKHRIRLNQGWTTDSNTHEKRQIWLGAYRYYYAPFDMMLEGTGGKFWAQDTGGMFELKRFFGDAAVALYYKNTETIAKKNWQAAGISFSFPLTFRRDIKSIPLQIRGVDEWGYGQESTLATGDQKLNNLPGIPLALIPSTSATLSRTYYNRDRLGEEYLRRHLGRLKEAWNRYRNNINGFW